MKKIFNITSTFFRISMVLVILLYLVQFFQNQTIEAIQNYASRHAKVQKVQQVQEVQRPDPANRYVRFLLDGGVQQLHYTGERDPNTARDIVEVYDENNVFIERRPDHEARNNSSLSFAQSYHPQYNKTHINTAFNLSDLGFSKTLEIPVMEGSTLKEIWRYNQRRQIFSGHDRKGNFLGYLGRQGLQKTASETKGLGTLHSFSCEDKNGSRLFWRTDHRLYEIDVKTRRVDCLVDDKNIMMDVMLAQAWSEPDKNAPRYTDPNLYRPMTISVSYNKTYDYHITLREPNQLITFSPPDAWNKMAHNFYRFSATKTDIFIIRSWEDFRPYPPDSRLYPIDFRRTKLQERWIKDYKATRKRHWRALYRIDALGELKKLKAFSWMETQSDERIQNSTKRAWSVYSLVKSVSAGLYTATPLIIGSKRLQAYIRSCGLCQEPSLFFLLKMAPQGPWDYLIPSLLFAALAFWHGRPRWTSKLHMVFWLVLVLCFNLAGLLTYLALNHTPLIRCASCRKKRGLAEDACARCQAPLPLPEHTRPHLLSLRSSC